MNMFGEYQSCSPHPCGLLNLGRTQRDSSQIKTGPGEMATELLRPVCTRPAAQIRSLTAQLSKSNLRQDVQKKTARRQGPMASLGSLGWDVLCGRAVLAGACTCMNNKTLPLVKDLACGSITRVGRLGQPPRAPTFEGGRQAEVAAAPPWVTAAWAPSRGVTPLLAPPFFIKQAPPKLLQLLHRSLGRSKAPSLSFPRPSEARQVTPAR